MPPRSNFYGGLFGWTFEDVMPPQAPSRYVIASLHGRDAARDRGPQRTPPGGTPMSPSTTPTCRPNSWCNSARTVRACSSDAGEGGRGAVLSDPEGAELRIWQARRRLGAQVANEPGAWNFSDLHTADAASAKAFYEAAFGWSVEDLGFATLIRRPGYGDHLEATVDPDIRARQQEVVAPPGFEDAIAWIAPRLRRATALARLVHGRRSRPGRGRRRAIGAEVLAQNETQWTRTALVRDPFGAEFTASQFTPPGE